MRSLIIVLVIGMIFMLVEAILIAGEFIVERLMIPCVAISGTDSHVAIPRYHLVTSGKVWEHIWQEHKGKIAAEDYDLYEDSLTLPVIDFDCYMVIAIFQGEGWNSKGLRIDSICEDDKSIIFRYDDKSYQTVGKGNKVNAYGFFILPRSTKRIIVEENVQRYGGEAPVWKKCPMILGLRAMPLRFFR